MLFSKNGKEPKKKKPDQEILDIWDDFSSSDNAFDVNGSYTGTPTEGIQPEQDPDDL